MKVHAQWRAAGKKYTYERFLAGDVVYWVEKMMTLAECGAEIISYPDKIFPSSLLKLYMYHRNVLKIIFSRNLNFGALTSFYISSFE